MAKKRRWSVIRSMPALGIDQQQIMDSIGELTVDQLQALAAAYFSRVDIDPEKVGLFFDVQDGRAVWWFQERKNA